MGFFGFVRRLFTALAKSAFSFLLVLLLLLYFWNLSTTSYFTTVVDDIFEHADSAAKDIFVDTILEQCEGGSAGIAGTLLDTAEGEGVEGVDGKSAIESLSALMELCTDEEALSQLTGRCKWLESNPTAKRFPIGFDSGGQSFEELQEACAALSSGEMDKICEEIDEVVSSGPLGSIMSGLGKACAAYDAGEGNGEDVAKVFLTDLFLSATGSDLGSIGGLVPTQGEEPKEARFMVIVSKAKAFFAKLQSSAYILVLLILALLVFMVAINLHHLDYVIKKISMGMVGPSLMVIIPFILFYLFASFGKIDTSPFFLALQGMSDFASNMPRLIINVIPFLFLRFYTTSLVIAAVVLGILGLGLRFGGKAALKMTKEETEEEKKKEEKKKEEPEIPKPKTEGEKKPEEEKKGEGEKKEDKPPEPPKQEEKSEEKPPEEKKEENKPEEEKKPEEPQQKEEPEPPKPKKKKD